MYSYIAFKFFICLSLFGSFNIKNIIFRNILKIQKKISKNIFFEGKY